MVRSNLRNQAYVVSRFHDRKFWLDKPIEVTKKIISRVTGYPTTDKAKAFQSSSHPDVENNMGGQWDGRALNISTIKDPAVKFAAHVIGYKIFQSSRPNSVPYNTMDMAYKIVKKDHRVDLAKLLLHQLHDNMKKIKENKSNTCKYRSLLVCTFLYLQKFVPGIGKVNWQSVKLITAQISDMMRSLGDNVNKDFHAYFKEFQTRMQKRSKIPK